MDSITDAQGAKRPKIITVCCILMFLGMLVMFAGLLTPSVRLALSRVYGPTFLPASVLTFVLGVGGMVGFWRMQKWGVYAYLAMTITSISVAFAIGIPVDFSYLMPLGISGVGLWNLKKMA